MNIARLLRGMMAKDRRMGKSVGRIYTRDMPISNVFTYRMGAGFVGDVNRTHPANIEQCLIDSVNPPTFFGQGIVADAAVPNGVRVPAAGDSGLTHLYGVTVRPFPFQQQTTSTAFAGTTFGGEAPPATGIIDVIRHGYVMVTLQGATAATKGGTVHMCIVAGTGYVVGGFSMDTVSGTFVTLDADTTFNGPADSNNIVELVVNS
jgi:hypothetical protein